MGSHRLPCVQCLNLVMQMCQIISYMNLTVGIFNHWSPSQRIGLLQHFNFSLLMLEQFQAERKFARIVQKLLCTLSPETLSKVGQLSQYCSCRGRNLGSIVVPCCLSYSRRVPPFFLNFLKYVIFEDFKVSCYEDIILNLCLSTIPS